MSYYTIEVQPQNKWTVPKRYQNLKLTSTFHCSADDTENDRKVFVKRLCLPPHKPALWKRAFRELKVLKMCKNHENIMEFYETWTSDSEAAQLKEGYISMCVMDCDLHAVLRKHHTLTADHVKYFLYQIFRGLKYLHSAGLVHRDINPAAIFVNRQCDLKIGELGLATKEDFTSAYVATQHYKSPELVLDWLMDYPKTDCAVDVWSAGCLMAEMICGKPLFPAKDSIDFIHRVLKVLGKVDDQLNQKLTEGARKYMQKNTNIAEQSNKIDQMFPGLSSDGLDILNKMLILDPERRITATEALEHPYFGELRDPEDEPVTEPLDFDFSISRSIEEWQRLFWQEIKEKHE